ncbi:MAG TPA: glycosyltransferase [Solirubrobacteraceae bacterium]|jgi:glycosyltransferase involved in cell wall biosynthesis
MNTVEVVIPVYNEQLALDHGVRTLHAHLIKTFDFSFRITIADNASTDATLDVARSLAQELDGVEVLYLDRKGRGHALRCAWSRSDAAVLAYMDVDLSTDLAALDDLLTPLLEGRGDLAIGSRLAPGADVTRGLRREVISRGYNVLLRALLGVTFSDAQCGFKAGRSEVLQGLLDDVQDDDWFFDTELLYLAQQRKLSIHGVPVRWVEDLDSRVQIVATAREDLRGVMRLRAGARMSGEDQLEPARGSVRRRLGWLRLGRLRSRSTGLPT